MYVKLSFHIHRGEYEKDRKQVRVQVIKCDKKAGIKSNKGHYINRKVVSNTSCLMRLCMLN